MLSLLLALQAATGAWVPSTRPGAANGSAVAAGIASREGNGRLSVRCDNAAEQVVSVQFIPRTPVGIALDGRPVTVTIDAQPPITDVWEVPDTGAGMFVRDGTTVTALTSAISKAKLIRIHTTDIAGAPVDASFAGPPSDAPIRQVLAACGYALGVVPPLRAPAPAEAAPR